jgi:hypothetical protein
MKNNQSLKPEIFHLPSMVEEKQLDKKGVTDEERHLYTLSKSAGWRILGEFIDRIKNDLDGLNDAAIEKGANFEEIGRNALVISLTKGVIKRIVNKVNDAKEACERLDE